MPRRYSEEPVNLIQILPSQEKTRTPNPLQPSVTRVALEGIAAGARGLAEMTARAGRRLQVAMTDLARGTQEYGRQTSQWVGRGVLQSRRLRQHLKRSGLNAMQWLAAMLVKLRAQASRTKAQAKHVVRQEFVQGRRNESRDEVASLKTQLLVQQQELTQVTSQMMELKALVMSQEQVLIYLGKELDTMHMPVAPPQSIAPKKVSKPKKSAKAKRVAPPQAAQKPSVTL